MDWYNPSVPDNLKAVSTVFDEARKRQVRPSKN